MAPSPGVQLQKLRLLCINSHCFPTISLACFGQSLILFHMPQVGSLLIELLVKTAYIQPPANQLADDPPDLRPAFVHSLKSVGPVSYTHLTLPTKRIV